MAPAEVLGVTDQLPILQPEGSDFVADVSPKEVLRRLSRMPAKSKDSLLVHVAG